MRSGGYGEGITHVEAKIGQVLDARQRITLEELYFGRARTPSEGSSRKDLG